MIGKIKGNLTEIDNNLGLIETATGLSYQVFLPSSLLGVIEFPQPIEVYTYLHVREDALILFGFKTKKEYELFTMLLTVPGVGPKTAFTVISFSSIEELVTAVKDNNINYFSRIPGLGKKTGMKIILELSQKLQSEFKLSQMYLSADDKTVIDALVSLGFKSQDAKEMLTKIPKDLSVEERIKEGIRIATNQGK